MNNNDDKGSRRRRESPRGSTRSTGGDGLSDSEYQRAMGRLEAAVRDLGDVAKGGFAERAADLLEQAAAHLKGAEDSPRRRDPRGDPADDLYDEDLYGDDSSEGNRRNAAGFSGRLGHWRRRDYARPVRDLDNKRIWGICSGIAPYLGLETWVVRCLAITGFVFMPQVVVPAYIISYFVLDEVGGSGRRRARQTKRARRRTRREAKREARKGTRERAKAPSTRPVNPGATLRSVQGVMNEAELRLRRMEGHVTSGRFELQRELRKIDA